MSHVRWEAAASADAPIMVIALQGLFDIAGAATHAVEHLMARATHKTRIASIDPELFFDFTQHRPVVSIGPGAIRSLRWPENDAYELELAGGSSALVAMSGGTGHKRRHAAHV